MLVTSGRSTLTPESHSVVPSSSALRWLWQYLADVPRPQFLDCGPLRTSTMRVLLGRCGKVYGGDMVSPAQRQEPSLWDRSGKLPLFKAEQLLKSLPEVPPGSLSTILSWQLFDLVPRDGVAEIVLHLYGMLEPGGVLFCLLRDARLDRGADSDWQLQNLQEMFPRGEGRRQFPYPALTNRDLDRLIPTGSVKTFLTRSGWREVLVLK